MTSGRLGALLALSAVLCVALFASASAAAQDPNAVLSSPTNESRSDAAPLWTKQRMLAAKPIDAPDAAPRLDRKNARALATPAGVGPEVLSSGASPFATVRGDRDVKDYQRYPERTHGRIFATTPGVGDFTCSGTLVSSAAKNLVYTAGHCLYDKETGQFAINVIFVPAYKQGEAGYDFYSAVDLFVLEGWANLPYPDAYSYDVAGMSLDAPLEQIIGARGIKFGVNPRGKRFDIYGYPARPDPPYDGERPIHCPKADFQSYENKLYPVDDPSIVAGPCYMMQGSSGGGWVLKGGFVNSVVSHGFCDDEPQLCGLTHGPYFAENAASIYDAAGGGNGKPRPSDLCRGPQADLRKAKKALKKAKKAKRKARKKGRKKEIKKARAEVRQARKQRRAAQKESDLYLC